MRLAGIDLNLLTSLDALLEAGSVTRAARTLGVTQPAASHALARLRALLGDPLLVRTPTGMRPTTRALELRPAVRAALAAAEVVLQAAPAFDPATVERTFAVAFADMVAFQLLPRVAARIARDAPSVRLQVRPTPQDSYTDALARDLDLAVGVFRDHPAGVRDQVLWRDDFVCVVRKGSAAARGPFDLARYLALSHIVIAPRGGPGTPLDDQLARRGHTRRIALTVPHFLVAPHVVLATDFVWTAPASLARALAAQFPLTLREPPLAIPGFDVVMRWHLRVDRDPGIAWLRSVLSARL
ncbi:MAG TPA: LysR family transcriptional regulator [Kofleriaceae bacterium]|nr:LysR family transcriptional regulator [Kofleriaceae bacterium]